MKDGPALLIELSLVSGMLAIILWIAWLRFGRAAHALTWACSYGLGALSYTVNAYATAHPSRFYPYYFLGGCIATLVINYLWVRGYRQRARLPLYPWRFFPAIILASAAIGLLTFVIPYRGIMIAITPLFMATMLFLASSAVVHRPRGSTSPVNISERASCVVQFLFGCLELGLTAAALHIGKTPTPPAMLLYNEILILGLPSFYIGNGLFNVLIIASDLARRMELLAETDTLTGLLNRRGFERQALAAIGIARSRNSSLAIVLADIDHFKRINDLHGHGIGDVALARFSKYLGEALPNSEAIGRLGGEEFVFLVPAVTPGEIVSLVEFVRSGVPTIPFTDLEFEVPSFTSSFGVTFLEPTDANLADLLARADVALYQAKETGRNRVCVFDPAMRPAHIPRTHRPKSA